MSVTRQCGFEGCDQSVTREDAYAAKHPTFYCSVAHRVVGVGERQRKGETRKCQRDGCPNTFYAERSDPKVYCSSKCFGAVYSAQSRVELPCAVEGCTNVVWRYRSQVPKTGRAFCPDHTGQRGAAPGEARGYKPRRGSERSCAREGCSTTFYASPASPQEYCSRECGDLARRKAEDRTCSQCGGTYSVTPSKLAWSGDSGTCGQRCFRAKKRAAAVGSRKTTGDGYVVVFMPDHPAAQPSTGYVMEHRLVMEEAIGRPVGEREEVHHRNGQRGDNRPGNLELWAFSQPAGQRVQDLVAWAREILEAYEPILDRLPVPA